MCVDRIHVTQSRIHWRAVANMVMNLQVELKKEILLSS
jgi:hypothetical protein